MPQEKSTGLLAIDRSDCAPGMIRTCDTRFRKPVLYPLSYEGILKVLTKIALSEKQHIRVYDLWYDGVKESTFQI
jgi:hypothetical protein